MSTPVKVLIIAVLAGLVVAAIALKNRNKPAATPTVATATSNSLPKLLDLGAGKCIPCKMMAPILEELKKDYADKFFTEFIDVWENEGAAKKYGVEVIPTQIFFDANGKELFRHVGFYSKEDILNKWKEFGINVTKVNPK